MANSSCPEPYRLLVTCEHGGNVVPPPYRRLFAGHKKVLQSHRGYDRYALDLATRLARAFAAPLLAAAVTRLLVDANRTPASRNLFSPFSRTLGRAERERIRAAWHTPHQESVARAATGLVEAGARVLHVAMHTFTPVLDGRVRTADLGLLYDPARQRERELSRLWLHELRHAAPELRLRRNYPYLGKSDCLASLLRRRLPVASYLGIEVEVNQAIAARAGAARLSRVLAASLTQALPEFATADKL